MQPGLRMCCYQTSEDRFSRFEAHIGNTFEDKFCAIFLWSDMIFHENLNHLFADNSYEISLICFCTLVAYSANLRSSQIKYIVFASMVFNRHNKQTTFI